MERSNGFYTPHATEESRSIMNVTFTLPNDELTAEFYSKQKKKAL